jgi:PAS domain-containing protein
MLANIRSIFRPPVFEDVEITRLAGLFNVILLATFGVALLACFGIVIFIPEQINQLLVMTVILPLIVLMLYLMRRGSVHLAIKIYTVSLWLVLTLLTIVFGGIHTPAFTSYVLVILIAGLLWSGRAAVYFAILTAVVGFAIAVLEILGLMVMPIYTTTPISTWVGQTANLTLISFFLYQTRDSLEQALNRARNEVSIRKRIEGALRQGETQLRYVLDTVPEGVMLLDNDGRINLANPVADKLLAILAPDREKNDSPLKRLGNYTLEKLFTSPPKGLWHQISANNLLFEAIARPVEGPTQNLGWVMVLRDVTQEREIQRQIQQQERLAAVGQLAAGIAHDFNNIMAVIILYAQMIARQNNLTPYIKEKLITIREQGQRAADLIQQILDFSRQSVLSSSAGHAW